MLVGAVESAAGGAGSEIEGRGMEGSGSELGGDGRGTDGRLSEPDGRPMDGTESDGASMESADGTPATEMDGSVEGRLMVGSDSVGGGGSV